MNRYHIGVGAKARNRGVVGVVGAQDYAVAKHGIYALYQCLGVNIGDGVDVA